MSHPLFHARSSARKYGGQPADYQAIHDWFDESKAFLADVRHRALRHHAEGIFLCEKIFGTSIVNSDGREVPVRFIGEQHVLEDLGRIRHIPATIVQGRYDMVCPIMSADDLARAWPEARYVVVPDAGHSAMEPGIRAALVDAMERLKR